MSSVEKIKGYCYTLDFHNILFLNSYPTIVIFLHDLGKFRYPKHQLRLMLHN